MPCWRMARLQVPRSYDIDEAHGHSVFSGLATSTLPDECGVVLQRHGHIKASMRILAYAYILG